MSQDLIFSDEKSVNPESAELQWLILIVDDEKEVHAVTTLALADFKFKDRGLKFLHAYTGKEAKEVLRSNPDIALVLLDVVMETDNAGLDVVEFVRNELKNNFVRIVLRTGQPGQAPELEVISRYDINDYKNKTELTRTRLFTTIFTGLATYRDLVALDANRRGLEKVIESSARIFEISSMEQFTQGVLEQLVALLFLGRDSVMLHASGVAAEARGTLKILAATGSYARLRGQNACAVLPANIIDRIQAARKDCGEPLYGHDYFAICQKNGDELIFYINANAQLSIPDRRLIALFCRNVSIAYTNLQRVKQLGAPDHK